MSELESFIYGSDNAYLIECIEIKHNLWSQPLRYVTNVADGVTVTQDGVKAFYQYAVLKVDRGNVSDDLDQKLSITVGDLGVVIPDLVDLIIESESLERPQVTYRAYSSLDLENPILKVDHLEITNQNNDYQGTTFEAEAEHLNEVGTGLLFTKENFPTLVGFY
ncbi:DUF1833 family protein [Acinetobacter junii]|uniref:DUF1833 family protein n=1 Tax=Acinetobacter junii TaxID=40215 RepID=UPI00100F369B|nr:DUF1833 family protein [Acinetobacter junii]RXS93955.1 DUF1833 domain-containing protein [Acinetobacter junii]